MTEWGCISNFNVWISQWAGTTTKDWNSKDMFCYHQLCKNCRHNIDNWKLTNPRLKRRI